MIRHWWLVAISCSTLVVASPGIIPITLGQETTETATPFELAAGDLVTNEADAAIQLGLDFLAKRQGPDGSFGDHLDRNLGVVGLAGMACLASGSTPDRGPYGQTVRRCVDYVLQHAQAHGYLATQIPTVNDSLYGHGFGTMFLAEVYGMSPQGELRNKLENAIRLIVETQNDEGGWRYEPRPHDADISVTVCQVMALRAGRNAGFEVPSDTVDRAIRYIVRCQNEDGGFSYQLREPRESAYPRSAGALTALYGVPLPNETIFLRGRNYLAGFDPQPARKPVDAHYYYGHYYAAQTYWHQGGDSFLRWYPAMRDVLLELQTNDGSWLDPNSRAYATSMATLVLQIPNNYLPIFRR